MATIDASLVSAHFSCTNRHTDGSFADSVLKSDASSAAAKECAECLGFYPDAEPGLGMVEVLQRLRTLRSVIRASRPDRMH